MGIQATFNQSATITTKGSLNLYGEHASGATVTVKCRFEDGFSLDEDRSITFSGRTEEEVTVDARAFVPAATAVNTEDTFTIDSQAYRVVKIRVRRLRKGNIHHKELILEKKGA